MARQVGEQGLSMVFAADDCGVGIAPVEHVVSGTQNVLDERGLPAKLLEARIGVEPTNKGFADLCLTTWLPRLFRLAYLTDTAPGSLKSTHLLCGWLVVGVEPLL
jgi:hypothetical protein